MDAEGEASPMDAKGVVSYDEDLTFEELIERRKQAHLPQAQKRILIGYAGEDYQFVELVKRALEPYVGSVWVDWENVVLFENNLAKEPAFVTRIHEQFKDAGLIIFVVSKSWVGKVFPMRELGWALALQDYADKVLSVLLDWSLTDAKKDAQSEPEYVGLLNTLLSLTMLNTKNTIRSYVGLAAKVAASVLELPGVAPKKAPGYWVPRDSDVENITEQLGMSLQGGPRNPNQGACVVAIEGMSGVGKSALLAHLYDVAMPKYVALGRKVVLVEVGHDADNAKIKEVQKQILGGFGILFKDGEDLKSKLQQALGTRGYALFLDDVWQVAADKGHLEDLFGCDWDYLLSKGLGDGSFVVIAGQALPERSWWYKYRLGVLDVKSAKDLFRNHAFDKDDDDCGLPWEEVVDACGGLPLALTVVGRQLYRVDKHERDGVLAAMKRATTPLARLKMAYLLLREEEHKKAFVDIAMHWHGKDWKMVAEALGTHLLDELLRRNLVDRARHDMYDRGETPIVVRMHDLLKKVGEGEAKDNHSWLEDPNPEKVATSKPRGLTLTEHAGKYEFKQGLLELRVLIVDDRFPGKIELKGCSELRWLVWHDCPDISVDLGQAAKMVWLELRSGAFSSIRFRRTLSNLKTLDLYGCTGLMSLPELSALTNLESLDLSGCTSLASLPDLSALTNLQMLGLRGCRSLRSLPDLSVLTSLETLELYGCMRLTSLPGVSALINLKSLLLSGCRSLTSLRDLSKLTNLETLELRNCTRLTSLPDLSALTKLMSLYLEGCTSLTNLPDLSKLTNLEELDLRDCTRLKPSTLKYLRDRKWRRLFFP